MAEAHWTKATRTGAFTYNPLGGGSAFVALDIGNAKPRKIEDYLFAPLVVGRARELLDPPLADLEEAYVKAGSPLAPYSEMAQSLGFSRNIVEVDDEMPEVGSIRGVATGWLSQEANLNCGSGLQNGRYFIIANFTPYFL